MNLENEIIYKSFITLDFQPNNSVFPEGSISRNSLTAGFLEELIYYHFLLLFNPWKRKSIESF